MVVVVDSFEYLFGRIVGGEDLRDVTVLRNPSGRRRSTLRQQ
jgi:hypothetical protein